MPNSKLLDGAVSDLTIITGQKPKVTGPASRSPASRCARASAIGAMVTLRGVRMWEFYDRRWASRSPHPRLPRPRPQGLRRRGNYNFGVTEQLIFPEIEYDSIDEVRGFHIAIVTTARTDDHGRALSPPWGSRSDARPDHPPGQQR